MFPKSTHTIHVEKYIKEETFVFNRTFVENGHKEGVYVAIGNPDCYLFLYLTEIHF